MHGTDRPALSLQRERPALAGEKGVAFTWKTVWCTFRWIPRASQRTPVITWYIPAQPKKCKDRWLGSAPGPACLISVA